MPGVVEGGREMQNMTVGVCCLCISASRYVCTWLSNSEGLIMAKRLKSIMVICLAISSGSKSNTLSTDDGVSGN